jgi:hypothetical protein
MSPGTPRALLLVMLDHSPEVDDVEFNQWYFEEHVPERLSCPGFISARRFRAVEGGPQYLALYELEGPEALETPQYLRYAHSPLIGDNVAEPVGSDRTRRMLAAFRDVVRNVYVEIDPADYPESGVAEPHLAP